VDSQRNNDHCTPVDHHRGNDDDGAGITFDHRTDSDHDVACAVDDRNGSTGPARIDRDHDCGAGIVFHDGGAKRGRGTGGNPVGDDRTLHDHDFLFRAGRGR
jgi:hypothetical protein